MAHKETTNVFILGITSDIGEALARLYKNEGCRVVGTGRNVDAGKKLEAETKIPVIPFDVGDRSSIPKLLDTFSSFSFSWDIFISAVGTMEPAGSFFSTDFESWEDSVRVNSTAQLEVLHALYPYRRKDKVSHVAFFAGGGTNNPFTNFSAYCVSKIMLIKMCELLDDENEDLNVFILGPGWVRTKMHQEVLNNPEGAGESYFKVQSFLNSDEPGTSHKDIYDCLNWCIAGGRKVVGGRNFSVVHDLGRDTDQKLAEQLLQDNNKFKLRRSGNLP